MKRWMLIAALLFMLSALSGCMVQPDPTLNPLSIDENAVPFGTVQSLPTPSPTGTLEPTPSPTPYEWSASDQSTWEDWAVTGLPTATPRSVATAAPGAQSWMTSTEDYQAGYPLLHIGSIGDDVSDLQARLIELGYFVGEPYGKYDEITQAAVMEFQQRNGLTADGIAGRQTQDLLYSSAAQPKSISAADEDQGYLLLKEGASGLEVRKLQARLAELGYYGGGVDGIYGESTVTAVKAFQRNNGLSGDGQAGELTQTKLYSANAQYAKNPVVTADPQQARSMSVGMTGNDVYAMQVRLIELRYLNGVADGVFGTETEEALKAFQKNNNLEADGVAGATTLRKLNGSARAATGVTPTPAPAGVVTLREGDAGQNVYALQYRLFELGYYSGRIDGRFTAQTTQAVIAFQQANGLTADGIAGSNTQSKLNRSDAVAAPSVSQDLSSTKPQITSTPEIAAMRRGDESEDVATLQKALKDLGYLSAEPDGQFGAETERAVKLFQEANGLTADGVAGRGTLSILFSGEAIAYGDYFYVHRTASPEPTATPAPNTEIVLQWQSAGQDVLQYQQRLCDLGYLLPQFVTGTFDQQTVDATKAFQTVNGLKVDGAAGPQSLELIYSDEALDANGNRRTVGDVEPVVRDLLKAGMSGDEVRRLQQRLAELGYLSTSFISGIYDEATQQAVRQFQQANGLSVDGAAGSDTQSRLYATGAVTAQVARVSGDNSERQNEEYRLNGAYQVSISGGGIVVADRNNLYCADASQGGVLVRRPYNGAAESVVSGDVPRFLHLTNGRIYYVASDADEDCIIRVDTASGTREVLCRAGIILRFALHDGCLYYLDANATLRERTLDGKENELMEGVRDFTLDAQGDALICVTQEGVISFGIKTGARTVLYSGYADQAALCGQTLLVRSGGNILRVVGGQIATIRQDGATFLGVYGQRVLQITARGVMACDVNGENATMLASGSFEAVSVANGVLYLGTTMGYTQTVQL